MADSLAALGVWALCGALGFVVGWALSGTLALAVISGAAVLVATLLPVLLGGVMRLVLA
jgi:hypothetical protein